MGNRLSKIYTRTGDDGTTGLGDGGRTEKDSMRMEAIGTVDELNSHVGMLSSILGDEDPLATLLTRIQHDLFDLGGELSMPGHTMIGEQRVTLLEEQLDSLNEELQPLKNFILPGGGEPTSQAHLARAVCRRAERRLVTLGRTEEINTASRQYINRLSDLLFVIARSVARREGCKEVLWQPNPD